MNGIDIDKAFCCHLGQRIRSAREHFKLSEAELANRLNPTRTAEEIRMIEAGLTDIYAYELNQLTIVLELPFSYFGNNGKLAWLDYELFFKAFVELSTGQRSKVIEHTFALAVDNPIVES